MFAPRFRLYRALLVLAVVASVTAPSTLAAQQPAPMEPAVAVTATAPTSSLVFFAQPGPATRELFAVSSDAWALGESAEAVRGGDARTGPDVALMIVGGAAVITGLVVGGDGGLIIATGGAVIGLVGLYRYLR